jgi:hypothetical protein
MSQYKLSTEIVARSVAQTWDEAKLEWKLYHIYWEDEPDTCLCGHHPINEPCILRNSRNQNTALVGNCCVKRFMELPSDKIFQNLKKIKNDEGKPINAETIHHAFSEGWINDWERTFSLNTMRKRALTEKQMAIRIQINQKILRHIVNQKPREQRAAGNLSR